MSRVFKGESDDLKYYETTSKDYRSVYNSSELAGLDLPVSAMTSRPIQVKLVRAYKWAPHRDGGCWHPYDATEGQKNVWHQDIVSILGGDK